MSPFPGLPCPQWWSSLLLALVALETGGSTPGQYESQPGLTRSCTSARARGAIKGRQATSEAERRRAQIAAGAQRRARDAVRRARSARANGRTGAGRR